MRHAPSAEAVMLLLAVGGSSFHPSALAQVERGPVTAEWHALAELPDWSGIWIPDVADQRRQVRGNPAPWTAEAGAEIATMLQAEESGRPAGIFNDCLPEGMPTWMMISHNAFEVLFTPGRVTLLGESDGNRLRRIYTDGRGHPEDPDLTYHGHSVGSWDGGTLVVDTVAILPEVYIAITEAVGVRNGGDVHVVERIYLADPDTLHVEMEITAPRVFTAPWRTTRIYERARGFDIIEGVCLQGNAVDQVGEDGSAIFVPVMPDQND
jgi:hypothetical protein